MWVVNEKFGQHSAINIDDMPIFTLDERTMKKLPSNWQRVKDSYKIHKCIELTAEQESQMKLMRNHKGMHRLYERSRVNSRERNWEYHITCRTRKPFIAQPQAEAPTSAERKEVKTKSGVPTFQLIWDPDKDNHIRVPGVKDYK
jgi:hypothetical protein